MGKHTEGPWAWERPQINKWVGDQRTNVDHEHESDEYSALIAGPSHAVDAEEVVGYFGCGSHHIRVSEPNGRLIAAAPDLLAALEALLGEFDRGESWTSTTDAARAAISKAKGA